MLDAVEDLADLVELVQHEAHALGPGLRDGVDRRRASGGEAGVEGGGCGVVGGGEAVDVPAAEHLAHAGQRLRSEAEVVAVDELGEGVGVAKLKA